MPLPLWRKKTQQGFTLLEVVAALAILSVALTYLLYTHEATVDTALKTHYRAIAATLAQNKLEEALARSLEELGPSGTFPNEPGFRWELSKTTKVVQQVELEEWEVRIYYPQGEKPFRLTVWKLPQKKQSGTGGDNG